MPREAAPSPVMAQWFALKAGHPDALLFFRMGDFFELFFSDAEAAAAALDIALTARGEHEGAPIPMCGVPVGTSELYLARLIRRGFRVAVAEQVELPSARQGRAPLRREVVRLVTPGTLTEDALLEAGAANLLLALVPPGRGEGRGGALGAAWLDVSTGLFETARCASAELPALLGRLDPAEILLPAAAAPGLLPPEWRARQAPPQEAPAPRAARRLLADAFDRAMDAPAAPRVVDGTAADDTDLGGVPAGAMPAGAGPDGTASEVLPDAGAAPDGAAAAPPGTVPPFAALSDAEAAAAGMALDYVRRTQAGRLPRLARPAPVVDASHMAMDAATRASLELLRGRDGTAAGSLLAAVDRTLTAPGARLLAARLAAPLTDAAAVARRQEAWGWLGEAPAAAASLRASLRGVPDVVRALGRLSLGRGGPRDLASVRAALAAASRAAAALEGASGPGAGPGPAGAGRAGLGHAGPEDVAPDAPREDVDAIPGLAPGAPTPLRAAARALRGAGALHALLERAVVAEPPARLESGGAVSAGYDGELDALRRLRDEGRQGVAARQLDYAQRFGVAALKVRHHAQLGYVLEAPSSAVEALRRHPELTLRQGMAQGARFTLPELTELDRRIAEAGEGAAARERLVFDALVAAVLAEAGPLGRIAEALAALDVAQASARLAEGGAWCRPAVTADEGFDVRAGRHPAVEAALARDGAAFQPNDCDLSPARRLLLLTGPNMAGKSTFLRQNALLAVLAQAGLPVPAASARIGVVDRLFSRVGGADDLARGRSTFMVEMTETAAILHGAGPRSLVVVDEIGRGTATLDGLAIAWAVLEALHETVRCRAIFATHFHELADLAGALGRLRPHSMRVREWRGEVVFLHEVAEGAAGRSWGVHVARLAGVPAPVVRRAGALLARLERGHRGAAPGTLPLFAAAGPDGGGASGRDFLEDGAAGTVDATGMLARGAAVGDAVAGEPAAAEGGHDTAPPVAAPVPDRRLHEALDALDPDRMSPREALDALYALRALRPGVTPPPAVTDAVRS